MTFTSEIRSILTRSLTIMTSCQTKIYKYHQTNTRIIKLFNGIFCIDEYMLAYIWIYGLEKMVSCRKQVQWIGRMGAGTWYLNAISFYRVVFEVWGFKLSYSKITSHSARHCWPKFLQILMHQFQIMTTGLMIRSSCKRLQWTTIIAPWNGPEDLFRAEYFVLSGEQIYWPKEGYNSDYHFHQQ